MSPTSDGRFKGIAVPRLPWAENRGEDPKPYAPPLDPSPKTEGEWVGQYEAWREARGYND